MSIDSTKDTQGQEDRTPAEIQLSGGIQSSAEVELSDENLEAVAGGALQDRLDGQPQDPLEG
jgi:hypothetical protein